MNFENIVETDPEKPYESMARRIVMSRFNGSSDNRINKAIEMSKLMDIDGVIYFCHWGCKQTMGAAVNAKKALEKAGKAVHVPISLQILGRQLSAVV